MDGDRFDIHVGAVATLAAGRKTLNDGLVRWECGNVDDMLLVFSELATNAAVHTAGASTTVITHAPPNVRLEVHDSSHAIPALRHDTHPGGFGLRIVDQLSQSWGWDRTATGKVVWSVMPCGD